MDTAIRLTRWRCRGQPDYVFYRRSQIVDGYAQCQMSRDRCEDVSAVEGGADFWKPVVRIGQMDDDLGPLACECQRENAVVRCHEAGPIGLHGNGPAFTTYAGIHDDDMDRAGREIVNSG